MSQQPSQGLPDGDRERKRIVAMLLGEESSEARHNLVSPGVPACVPVLDRRQAMRRLRVIGDAIERCKLPNNGDYFTSDDPVCRALREVAEKWIKCPDGLRHSSKLYRAICDLELAMTMPAHADHMEELSAVVDELRRLTGWSLQD